MNDQKSHWNKLHQENDLDLYSQKPTGFANEVLEIINPNSQVLELGCGVGNDSYGFAHAGHTVLGTDFSEVAISKNLKQYQDIPNLSFRVMDMSQPMDLKDKSFDVVYARLSLHYFTDEITRKIFKEIKRVLKSNGFLCFMCKSIDDPHYRKGRKIEKEMYENKGHVRHFFSKDYVDQILNDNFEILKLETNKEVLYGSESAFIKVIAKVEK